MSIKQATIKGYQSHKHTVLNFHSGVNVLVGLTDCGKSALMRAMQWPVTNKNDDRGFRSKWGGKCDVELVFADGRVVSRVQDKDNAYYLYDTTESIDEEYKAFKTDIPEDIVHALNMSDINIQSQFDSPFLLADSAGDVAKTLNKMADLTDIDDSISNIRKLVLANSKECTATESLIVDLETQAEGFKFLASMEQNVVELENLQYDEKAVIDKFTSLDLIIMSYETAQKEIAELDTFLKAETPLTLALALVEQQKTVTGQIRAIETIINKVGTLQTDIKEIEHILEAESELNTALKLVEQMKQVQIDYNLLGGVLDKVNTYTKSLEDKERTIVNKQAVYNDLMPKECPLCGKGVK